VRFVYQKMHKLDIFIQNLRIMAKTKSPVKLKINRLKVVLAEIEMSHKDLAKKVKKAPNTITRICNNESQPTLKLLREIAIALNIDIRDLLVPTKG
jgi:putative transcriptional regulator